MSIDDQSISFEIKRELPIRSWRQFPSNAFARQVTPEMLSENGLQVIDVIGSRHSRIALSDREKAIYTFDRDFIVATIQRLFQRLKCDKFLFAELVCDALQWEDDSALRHVISDDCVSIEVVSTESTLNHELESALRVIKSFKDYLSAYRALLPAPNEKGEYSARYSKAVALLERLENILKYDCGADFDGSELTTDTAKKMLARL